MPGKPGERVGRADGSSLGGGFFHFDRALRAAVDEAAVEWGPGEYEVEIALEATIEVTNPGEIGQYRIVLRPKPGA